MKTWVSLQLLHLNSILCDNHVINYLGFLKASCVSVNFWNLIQIWNVFFNDYFIAYIIRLSYLFELYFTLLYKNIFNSIYFSRCSVKTPTCRGKNVHVIAGISQQGMVHWERRRGSFRKPDCQEWVRTSDGSVVSLQKTAVAVLASVVVIT